MLGIDSETRELDNTPVGTPTEGCEVDTEVRTSTEGDTITDVGVVPVSYTHLTLPTKRIV